MENLRKAFIMLGAAIMINTVAADAAEADDKEKVRKPGKGKVTKKKEAQKKKRVKRVEGTRRRPRDHDLGMPAGTLYDVIQARDLG